MSTDYYLVCEECLESNSVITFSAQGKSELSNGLREFIIEHTHCKDSNGNMALKYVMEGDGVLFDIFCKEYGVMINE